MAKTKKLNYIFAIGKRKSASARVRLFKGTEESTVNGQLIGKYFTGEASRVIWNKPFEETDLAQKYYFTVKVAGGGRSGQLEAVVLGLSRALAKVKDTHKKTLRKAGLLTRDSRIRERRKVGMGGKARRKRQSPKR